MTVGPKVKLPEGFGSYDFVKLARKAKHPRERVRFIGLSNLQKGKGIREVARMLFMHENTVRQWVRKFRKNGVEGLREQPGRGAKRKLPKEKEEEFRKAILKLQANRKGGRIRGTDVLHLMKEELGIDCSLDTAYLSLKRANFVWITSRSQHPKANKEAQETFKKTL